MSKTFEKLLSVFGVLILLLAFLLNLILIFRFSVIPESDFAQDYRAAKCLLDGCSIYSFPNSHFPFNALFFLPFVFFDEPLAFKIFLILSLVFFAVAVWKSCLILGYKNFSPALFSGVILLSPWILAGSSLGVSTTFISALVISAFLFSETKNYRLEGLCIALATMLRIYPGLLFLYLVFMKRSSTFLMTVLYCGVGSLATLFLCGSNDIKEFFVTAGPKYTELFIDFRGNLSLLGLVERWFGSTNGWTYPELQLGSQKFLVLSMLLLFVTWLLFQVYRNSKDNRIAFSATCVAMPLLSPISWGHYLGVIIPALLIICSAYKNIQSLSKKILIIISLFLVSGIPNVLNESLLDGNSVGYLPAHMTWGASLATLGLLGILYTLYCLSLLEDTNSKNTWIK